MKKISITFSDAISAVFCGLILAGFTFTTIGWVLWSAKWVLGLLGVV
jgi:hypothetical protein